MIKIILQTIGDELLFTKLNPPIANKTRSLIYYKLPEFNYDSQFLIYRHDERLIYLCEYEEPIVIAKSNENFTQIGKMSILGNYTKKEFIKIKVIAKLKLRKKIKFPEEDKTYNLSKPIHERLHLELLETTNNNKDIYEYLLNDSDINKDKGYIAYKFKEKWGFLEYERISSGDYNFSFTKVNNFIDNIKLQQYEEGFKDFTYFIKSQSLPKAYKIGRAESPDQRLRQIQAHNARNVELDLVLADGRLELYFHNKFNNLRISDSREWFEMGDDLVDFIEKEKKKRLYIIRLFEKSSAYKIIKQQIT